MTKSLLLLLPLCLMAQAPAPTAPEVANLPAGLYAVFQTSAGTITARLYEKEAPKTVANFVGLAQGTRPWRDPKGAVVRRPLYNNITFHRVTKRVMIQAGDPTGTGFHACGVKLEDEILPGLTFNSPGRLAMANTGEPNSGGCQFFLTEGTMSSWNGKYTVFGNVVAGLDVITAIANAPAKGDKPLDPVKLITVTIHRIGPEPKGKKAK